MSTIGIIYCAHQTAQYVGPSLAPWIRARKMNLNGDTYVICAVSVPFLGFPNDEPADGTVDLLHAYRESGEIDNLITSSEPVKETEARGTALDYLIGRGVDTVIQWDSDEVATIGQLDRVLTYVRSNPFTAWFRLSYKNYMGDAATYLTDPFTPPRIHRVQVGAHRVSHFSGDNDIAYGSVHQSQLANQTIPPSVAFISHFSWMSDLRSKRKVEYQLARGWQSSYRWNKIENRLEFNPEYYAQRGLPLPEVTRDLDT